MTNKGDQVAHIVVASGRHVGAKQSVPVGTLTIGSSLDADVVLTDPSVAPLHARMTLLPLRFQIEAVSDLVQIANKNMKTGEKSDLRYPAMVVVGDVKLELTGLQKPETMGWRDRYLGQYSSIQLWSGAFGVLFITAIVITGVRSYDDTAAIPAAPSPQSLKQALETRRIAAQDASKILVQSAANALRERLLAVNLSSIVVTTDSGSVVAKGVVEPDLREVWDASQLWFDQSFGQKTMLQSHVSIVEKGEKTSPIVIQSIWAGKMPYLIDGNGEKFFEGALLKDGWLIEKIDEGQVLLRRNQEILSLKV